MSQKHSELVQSNVSYIQELVSTIDANNQQIQDLLEQLRRHKQSVQTDQKSQMVMQYLQSSVHELQSTNADLSKVVDKLQTNVNALTQAFQHAIQEVDKEQTYLKSVLNRTPTRKTNKGGARKNLVQQNKNKNQFIRLCRSNQQMLDAISAILFKQTRS